MIKKRNKKFRI